jgi:RNA polymerase sigma-70 factor (ECF subfamily)
VNLPGTNHSEALFKHTEKVEDERLIGDFLIGNKGCFDRLVLRYQNRVVNLCFRMIGDYEEAVDCAQLTFMKVFRSLGHFRFQSSFSTWLDRIAVNT